MAPFLIAAAAATTGPSWFWFATRGLGIATLIILTATVVLGIGTANISILASDVSSHLTPAVLREALARESERPTIVVLRPR